MKLSPLQDEIVTLMRKGWALACDDDGGCWLEPRWLGEVEPSRSVGFATVRSLYQKGLLRGARIDASTRQYFLKEEVKDENIT